MGKICRWRSGGSNSRDWVWFQCLDESVHIQGQGCRGPWWWSCRGLGGGGRPCCRCRGGWTWSRPGLVSWLSRLCEPTIDPEEGPSGNENDDDDDCGRDSAGEVNIYKAPWWVHHSCVLDLISYFCWWRRWWRSFAHVCCSESWLSMRLGLRFVHNDKFLFRFWAQGLVKILKLKFRQDFKAEVWSVFCC